MLHKIKFISFILIILFSKAMLSQSKGSVEYYNEFQLNQVLDKHIAYNKRTINKGYRIKIQFSSDKATSIKVKNKFSEEFTDVPAYIKYDQPYFSVRVGNYRTKLEAYKFLKEVQKDYPASFLIEDEILFEEEAITQTH